jgi:uncharacterized protein
MPLPSIDEPFMGRSNELRSLEKSWADPAGAFLPVYGRRRVGKSELIRHFIGQKRGIYYVGKQAPADLQLREFMRDAAECLGEPLLAEIQVDGWARAFKLIEERWKGPEKLILALDEFQWMCEVSPDLPSVIQEAWDRRWKKGGIMLILCGSYLGFMEREVLGKKSPLFGRRTGQILLRPFDHKEAALFHPGYSLVEQARTYFVCGGLPFYLKCFSQGRSVEQNIADAFLTETGLLRREADFLLREELRELVNYHSILMALAEGKHTNSGISAASGIGDRALHFYLTTLMELGYVRKKHPLTGSAAQVRQGRYVLDDPLLRFWFRFVFPQTSLIARLGPSAAMERLIKPGLDAYFGICFEALCREALPMIYAREGVTAAFEVGEYWDKDSQIDVVGLRKDGWTDLGECKWTAARSPTPLREELEARVPHYPNSRRATIHTRYFTRTKITQSTPPPATEHWHDLEDIYAV